MQTSFLTFLTEDENYLELELLKSAYKDDKNWSEIDHFTGVCLVALPVNESWAGVDLVLIKKKIPASLMLMMLFFHAN